MEKLNRYYYNKSPLKVEEIRKNKNISTNKLSRDSGIARGYITEREEGRYQNPSLQIICKLCRSLNVSPNELIPETEWRGGEKT